MQHDFEKLEDNLMHRDATKKGMEKRELSLWDKWVDEESPDTFGFLELAKDGGFSEVKDLYDDSRWATAAILIIFVIYNVVAIIMLDLSFMFDPKAAAESLGTELGAIEKFYFSTSISEAIAKHFGYDHLSPVQIIGALELLGLSFFLLNLLYCSLTALCGSGFRRWFSIQTIFWDILPTLSVYSAMRLLYCIVPAVLTARLFELIAALQEAKAEKKSLLPAYISIAAWVFTLIFSFIVGFDTFLMKLRVVSASANQDSLSLSVLLSTVQFLVQVLGVVQLGPFVRQRLFKFIFGGEDGVMQDEEVVLMETWNALLCKRMYRDLPFKHFIAVMASFSDTDFQGLVLNENTDVKKTQLGE